MGAALVCSVGFTATHANLDAAIRTLMGTERVPGLSFAVVRGGRIVRTGSYGFANLEWKTPVSVHTKFEIASISKMFAGAAARILIEDGKLDPESPVGAYFHGIPDSWRGMKVRHLITMSSGLPEDFGNDTIPYDQDVATIFDDASMVRSFFNLEMPSPVGTRFHYSGPNYAMLGLIVANVSGVPFADFVRQHVFIPAAMTESSYIDHAAIVPERAEGYRRTASGDMRKGRYLAQYLHARADVGVLTSAGDLARWLIALEQGRVVREPEKLWEPTTSDAGRRLDYAYGWFQDTWLGHRRFQHSGGYRTGFRTYIARYPDDDLGVVVLTNSDFASLSDYLDLIVRQYITDVPKLDAAAMEHDTDPAETARSIRALQSLARGSIDESIMFADAADPFGADAIAGILKGTGPYRYAGRARVRERGLTMHGQRLVSYDALALPDGARTHFAALYRDATGKIAFLELIE